MKRIFLVTFLLIASCSPSPSPTPDITPSLDAFEFSEWCPDMCWLGIKPGYTTEEGAREMLIASDQIAEGEIHELDSSIHVDWFSTMEKTFTSNAFIIFRDGLVQRISFTILRPFTIQDFINLLGEPDEISLSLEEPPDAYPYIIYTLYYNTTQTRISAPTSIKTGPNPIDNIDLLTINADFDDQDLPTWMIEDYRNRQPWLGYGHLEEYFPDQMLPTLVP